MDLKQFWQQPNHFVREQISGEIWLARNNFFAPVCRRIQIASVAVGRRWRQYHENI